MTEPCTTLKEYTHAPVGEVTLVVCFKRINNLSVYRLSHFVEALADAESFAVSEQNEIVTRFETELAEWRSPSLRFGPAPLGICFSLMNSGRTSRIMVQADRFSVTWMRQGGNEYARFNSVRDSFFSKIRKFETWLAKEKLQSIEIQQCEVQYVNLVEEDGSAAKNFNFIDIDHFRDPEGIHFVTSQRLADAEEVGRLYIEATTEQRLMPGQSNPVEQKQFLKVMLTFRGQPKKEGFEGVQSHFQRGNYAIVSTFSGILSEYGRKTFGEKERSNG